MPVLLMEIECDTFDVDSEGPFVVSKRQPLRGAQVGAYGDLLAKRRRRPWSKWTPAVLYRRFVRPTG